MYDKKKTRTYSSVYLQHTLMVDLQKNSFLVENLQNENIAKLYFARFRNPGKKPNVFDIEKKIIQTP